jgi:hypothetical protein
MNFPKVVCHLIGGFALKSLLFMLGKVPVLELFTVSTWVEKNTNCGLVNFVFAVVEFKICENNWMSENCQSDWQI